MISNALMCLVVAMGGNSVLVARCSASMTPTPLYVRLAHVSLPDNNTPYGKATRRNLRDLCLNKVAEIVPRSIDIDGLTLADVRCGETSAQQYLISQGLAQVKQPISPEDTGLLKLQMLAQQRKLGQWQADTLASRP